MSDTIFESKVNGMASLNTALQSAFARTGARCFLLKREGQTKRFSVVGSELTSGYYVHFDENRSEGGLFRYATTDDDFADVWSQASHIAYGVPTGDDEMEVFAFVEGEKDALTPSVASPFWSGRMVKEPKERFTIPA